MNRSRFLSPNWLPRWTIRFALFAFLCALALALTPRTGAHGELRVDESKTLLSLIREPAELRLPLENQTGSPLDATIQLSVLNTDDRVLATVDKVETIPAGNSVLKTTVPFRISTLTAPGKANLIWMRLSYRITANGATLVTGILPFSEITGDDLFEIRVVNSLMVKEGGTYRVRVQTINPLTHKPVRSVHIATRVTLEDDDEDVVFERFANTGADGFATLDFKLPQRFPQFPHELDPAGGKLEVVATRGAVVRELTADVLVDQFFKTVLTTDKPIYQPSQVVHARALLLSPSRRVLPNQEVTFFVQDPEEQVVFQSKATTSRFGIASVDWTIADNSRLGDYRLGVRLEGQDDEWLDLKYLRVSRYELPNFSVNVIPDRKYYLSGENAEVTVNADYLFGQKVSKGHVKVVRETSREWNYREQKWDINEGAIYEGETNADGAFVTRIDLSEHHNEIKDNEYRRFDDIEYAAYFTDPTTNRTEQRRFALRISKEPIHVYLQRLSNDNYNPRLPNDFYVSAFYADGAPAQCRVDLTLKLEDGEDTRVVKAKVQTNQYGLAKVAGLRVPRTWESTVETSLIARDSLNRTGTETESIDLEDDPTLLVATNKTLYRTGEPIVLTVKTDLKYSWVFVDIGTDSNLIRTERLHLNNGQGVLRIPYRKEFQERLWITAYPAYPATRESIGSRSILFPGPRNLKIEAKPAQTTYRPGESARIDFRVSVGSNITPESALGVVVFDRAVEERNRTDQEFGRNHGSSLLGLLGEDEALAGVTYNQLRNIDMSKPVPASLELLAEILLNQSSAKPSFSEDEDFEEDPLEVFKSTIGGALRPLKDALTRHYAESQEYPRDLESLRRILEIERIDLSTIRDPWGRDFNYQFSTEEESDYLRISCSGADRKYATDDDFLVWNTGWHYFRPVREAIEGAVYEYHRRTGGFIRDFNTLRTEVQKSGISLETLRDRWGQPYRFTFAVKERALLIIVSSSGPNRRFEQDKRHSDDFELSSTNVDYFSELRASIDQALTHYTHNNQQFPASEKELQAALKRTNIDLESLRDAWGQPVYFSFGEVKRVESGTTVQVHSRFGESGAEQVKVTSPAPSNKVIYIRSAGPDQSTGTQDDFDLAAYENTNPAQPADEETNAPITLPILFQTGGMITGTVVDGNGNIVAGAKVVLDSDRSTETDQNGRFQFGNVPSGKHVISVDAVGFKKAILTDVPVSAIGVTTLRVVLQNETVSEAVTVTASGPSVQQTRTLSALPVAGQKSLRLVTKSGSSQDFFTPRLREYFPETLLWQPELTTDKRGRAQLDFKLADNITTWKMSVIGSTENGEIGTAETEIRAFQPFFAELDPPRVLTQGDRISLPVVLRNYLPNTQTVDVELKPESWFSVLDSIQKRIQIPAGEAKTPTFDLRTNSAVANGKQRVTARATDFSDAIEKTVNVHPDGEQRAVTMSEIFEKNATVSVDLPEETIPHSHRVELKIYPNLLTHVWESVEGIMQRPYGCGEQTISSSYPSLLVLKHLKAGKQESPLARKARSYVESGYQRLLGYQRENGGFGYWAESESDLAVTAYAIRFLNDAAEAVSIDREVIESAAEWLVRMQRQDGSWAATSYDEKEDRRSTELLTSLIARALAVSEIKVEETKAKNFKRAVSLALKYLEQASVETGEPYLIANYALAARAAGDINAGKQAVSRLRSLSLTDRNGVYWSLETNTPFYGWGRAGRLETTALALQAIAGSTAEEKDAELRNRGLLFLLREQDRYGLWYSTQATINVLDALLSMLSPQAESGNGAAELLVNGRVVQTVELPGDQEVIAPVVVDLSTFVNRGHNEVQLRRTNGQIANLQLVSTYYLPWTNRASDGAPALRLQTSFDKTNARVMEEITCRVKAERVDPRGYGMLLAEIGLPPGADVDRASLEAAMKNSGWSINRYDVLPEKVVVYLWPRTGGTEFTFKFRPRFAMTAKSEPSTVYDYYNPEANAVVAPTMFTVR